MKPNRASFWKGFLAGGLLFAALGALYANQIVRMHHGLQSLGGFSDSAAFQQARIEAGLYDQAINVNRSHAWIDHQDALRSRCMAEHKWLLWGSTALEECVPGFTGGDMTVVMTVPENWEPIGIENAREHFKKMKAMQQAEKSHSQSTSDSADTP